MISKVKGTILEKKVLFSIIIIQLLKSEPHLGKTVRRGDKEGKGNLTGLVTDFIVGIGPL